MFDKLITINYPHSYGGDFLANLIMKNDMVISEGLTTTYTTPGITSSHGVKNLDIIVGLWRSELYRAHFFNENTLFARRQIKYFEIVFDNEETQFKRNIVDDLRGQMNHLRETLAVFNTHHTYGNQLFLPLHDIFPGSINIALDIDNRDNEKIYKFLLKKKALDHYNNTSVYSFYRNRSPEYMNNETIVYMDRLLFENGYRYVHELEDMFGVEFRLSDIDSYREFHKKLLIDNGLRYETMFDW